LPSPWNDLDGDAVAGAPSAGQVRLGTDPNAGITPLVNGIPILGGTTAARGGGDDNNFFRYRLPYMSDYSTSSGIQYTPSSQKPRYFKKPSVSLNAGTDLTLAGDYPNFSKDYWIFQVARYRHAFTLGTGASPRENGSYILVHFKKESYFEEFVRDGVVPTDDKLWSANMIDWTDPEDPSNLASVIGTDGAAGSYHILRSAILEDDAGSNAPTVNTAEFDYSSTVDQVVRVSGIAYFLPQTFAGADNFTITDFSLDVSGLWQNTYRTFDDSTSILSNPNPGFLYMGAYSFTTENPGWITVPVGFVTNSSQVRKQRVEYQFQDLGAFTTANGPLPSDNAVSLFSGGPTLTFAGDTSSPSFSADAKIRFFARRPVGHQTVSDYDSSSLKALVGPSDSKKILFHSTRYHTGVSSPVFGNFQDGLGDALSSLETPDKDTKERFLDEVYRYRADWVGVAASLGIAVEENLSGPGLPNVTGSIDIPVRAGRTAFAGFEDASWIQRSDHEVTLPTGELQVAGCPDRNPPLAEGVLYPFPSAGVIRYPEVDYITGNYRPEFGTDLTTAQFDYSGLTGTREYVRVFDADFSRSASVGASGSSFVTFKIIGVKLEDFEYTAPGPGKDLALFVKVPGLTTWMDLGRVDGSGPSKQDISLDGAGCKVLGPDTFDGIDTETGLNYCQVKAHVGPAVVLFTNTENEVPVLFKVQYKDTVDSKKYDLEYNFDTLSQDPNAKSRNVRGVVTIEVVN
jgi:hypothetical protein